MLDVWCPKFWLFESPKSSVATNLFEVSLAGLLLAFSRVQDSTLPSRVSSPTHLGTSMLPILNVSHWPTYGTNGFHLVSTSTVKGLASMGLLSSMMHNITGTSVSFFLDKDRNTDIDYERPGWKSYNIMSLAVPP